MKEEENIQIVSDLATISEDLMEFLKNSVDYEEDGKTYHHIFTVSMYGINDTHPGELYVDTFIDWSHKDFEEEKKIADDKRRSNDVWETKESELYSNKVHVLSASLDGMKIRMRYHPSKMYHMILSFRVTRKELNCWLKIFGLDYFKNYEIRG